MSDPKEQQREGDELDLNAETISDLDTPEHDADRVRGGDVFEYTVVPHPVPTK